MGLKLMYIHNIQFACKKYTFHMYIHSYSNIIFLAHVVLYIGIQREQAEKMADFLGLSGEVAENVCTLQST